MARVTVTVEAPTVGTGLSAGVLSDPYRPDVPVGASYVVEATRGRRVTAKVTAEDAAITLYLAREDVSETT